MKKIKQIIIHTIPKNTGTYVEPCIEIMEGKNYNMIWTDNPKHTPLKYGCVNNPQVYNANKSSIMQITVFNEDVNLCGDLFFRLINARNG